MAAEEDEGVAAHVEAVIGGDLSLLSIEELEERITLLESEIARLRAAVKEKSASKTAAEQIFKS